MSFEHYQEAIRFIEGLSNVPLRGDYRVSRRNPQDYLRRTKWFLKSIGNPEKGFKLVHITGTSGKGTVTAMVHEILRAAGKRVGSFTSPLVSTSIEKITAGDRYISPHELAEVVETLKPALDRAYLKSPYGKPSYFELFLAIALVYFKRKRYEWVVLEVGLGGRYDATNVIEKPAVAAITNIDYDHTEILGKTLKEIATDKAGIIKKGSAFFTTESRPALLRLFQEECRKKKASFHPLPCQGGHAEKNRTLATAIAKRLGIGERAIVQGIQKVRLPCRFEIVQKKPWVVLDGAHNRAKVASAVENLEKLSFRKLHLVLGMAANKQSMPILKQLIPLADRVYFTRFQTPDRPCAHPKALLAKSAPLLQKGVRAEVFLDPGRALSRALGRAHPKDLILVVGSFFLAGELRKRWFPEERVLRERKSFW